ncbi:MAG: hypothetical protein IGNPGNKH_00168 [Sodalis sp. Ffu]|nr:MAG: hypothetical protein IGNPGNKH_00168 [Sodalis sp. Ffu]
MVIQRIFDCVSQLGELLVCILHKINQLGMFVTGRSDVSDLII